jgi:protoheme IX farnesyltransferase
VAYIAAFTLVAPLLTLLNYTGYAYALIVAGLGIVWFWKGIQRLGSNDDVAWARKMFGFSLLVLLGLPLAVIVDLFLP